MSNINEHIPRDQHLTEYQLSVAADALIANQYDLLEEEISLHIEICPKCKSEVFSLVDVINQMDIDDTKDTGKSEEERRSLLARFQWEKWLAAASIILLMISSVVFWQNSNQYKSELIVLQDSLDKMEQDSIIGIYDSLQLEIKKRELMIEKTITNYSDSLNELSNQLESASHLLAESYNENKSFEDQIRMNLRSSSIQVKTAKHIEKDYGGKIKLFWDSDDSLPMSIAIYNNKGLLVLKENDLKSNYLLNSNLLTPGAYYWKLIGKEGVVFIGKISLN
jgi:hypothetical protein